MDEFLQEQESQASQHLRQFEDSSLGKGNPLLELLQALAVRLEEREPLDLPYPALETFQNLVEDEPQRALDCLLHLMDRENAPVPQNFQDLEHWAQDMIGLVLQELRLFEENLP